MVRAGIGRLGCSIPMINGQVQPMIEFWALAPGSEVSAPTKPIDLPADQRTIDDTVLMLRMWFANKEAAQIVAGQVAEVISLFDREEA